ncbi:MAG: hypothetical protein AB7F43_00745 [Bacteriovoracia bacterium]
MGGDKAPEKSPEKATEKKEKTKEVSKPAPSASARPGKKEAKLGCKEVTCKSGDKRAGFCDEHFRQFKFGLITKDGEPVPDYERKFEHYQAWLRAHASELKRA